MNVPPEFLGAVASGVAALVSLVTAAYWIRQRKEELAFSVRGRFAVEGRLAAETRLAVADIIRRDPELRRPRGSVLVVDEQDAVREVVAEALSLGGYEVSVAKSVAEALKQVVRRGPPDVVLADIMLRNREGGHFLLEVKRFAGKPLVLYKMGTMEILSPEGPQDSREIEAASELRVRLRVGLEALLKVLEPIPGER